MTELLHKELTGAIIAAYYEVYNHTSRTFPEYIKEWLRANETSLGIIANFNNLRLEYVYVRV